LLATRRESRAKRAVLRDGGIACTYNAASRLPLAVRGCKLNTLEFIVLSWFGALAAGFLGSLTGLGGGVVIVPLLTLAFGVDMRYAIGASLISVIATSSGAAAAYVKEGFSNIRVGMFLEIATTLGALAGALIAVFLRLSVIAVILGLVLLYSASVSFRPPEKRFGDGQRDRIASFLGMDGTFPTSEGSRPYHVRGVPAGFSLMFVAGVLSGLLGIGSGAIKVLAMDRIMRLPFKVSTTTSNFMIGVTAAASAGVYLNRGYIDPVLAMPVMLGVLGGSLAGTYVLATARVRLLRLAFGAVIAALAVEMIFNGISGKFGP
jgi:uncharacterized membrane protein YfcA